MKYDIDTVNAIIDCIKETMDDIFNGLNPLVKEIIQDRIIESIIKKINNGLLPNCVKHAKVMKEIEDRLEDKNGKKTN